MKILAIECSASPVSVCIAEDEKIISNSFSNISVTHSQTLMPMINSCLSAAKTTLNEIDGFAVANGPGSFTGIRIGISAVKGMAAPGDKPCVGVSTLLAMASRFPFFEGIISPVMDARCNQVYNALFRVENGQITRLTPDRALMCDELKCELSGFDESVIICGDGIKVFSPYIADMSNIKIAENELAYQNATGVAVAAFEDFKTGKTVSPKELLPVYLRLPQAERELKQKLKKD